MLDGLQLLGIINRRYPGLKIAVMTGSATEAKNALMSARQRRGAVPGKAA